MASLVVSAGQNAQVLPVAADTTLAVAVVAVGGGGSLALANAEVKESLAVSGAGTEVSLTSCTLDAAVRQHAPLCPPAPRPASPLPPLLSCAVRPADPVTNV